MDYAEISHELSKDQEPQKQYYPPHLGAKGYRSSSVLLGIGDKTPGYGILTEYNFNRAGIGASLSWLPVRQYREKGQYFFNLYGTYYVLPFVATPYILAGIGFGGNTLYTVGPVGGAGLELMLYRGFVLSVGYTYHGTVRRGYPGVSVGVAF